MNSEPEVIARQILEGDVRGIPAVTVLTEPSDIQRLRDAILSSSPPGRDAVKRALTDVLEGAITFDELRAWAAFIRWGEAGRWIRGSHYSVFEPRKDLPSSFETPIIEDLTVETVIAAIDDEERVEAPTQLLNDWLRALDET